MADVLMVDRKEDMSPDGWMRLIMEPDGDIIVSVAKGKEDGGLKRFADVQFCTLTGGGKSQRTLKALRGLMIAMAQDNADAACNGRQGEFSGDQIIRQLVT